MSPLDPNKRPKGPDPRKGSHPASSGIRKAVPQRPPAKGEGRHGPASSVNLRAPAAAHKSGTIRLSKTGGKDGRHGGDDDELNLMGGAGRLRDSEMRPGLFRLSVKFILVIAVTIGIAIGIVGFLTIRQTEKTIYEEIDRAGMNLVRTLGIVHSEFWRTLYFNKEGVDDLRAARQHYQEIVDPQLRELVKQMENPASLTPEQAAEIKRSMENMLSFRYRDLIKRRWPDPGGETMWQNLLWDLRWDIPNDTNDKSRADSLILNLLIFVPDIDRPGESDIWEKGLIFQANTGATRVPDIDKGWEEYQVVMGGKPVSVNNIHVKPATFLNGVFCRAFRATIRNADGAPAGYIVAFISQQKIVDTVAAMKQDILRYSFVGIGIGVVVAWLLSFIVVRPVKRLIADVNVVAKGDLDHRALATSSDEIGVLGRAFNNMARNLKNYIQMQLQSRKREAEVKQDMNVAAEIQEKLLPDSIPTLKGFDLHAFYRPSKDVGGDYYDFIIVDPTHMGFVVADVSGKGIPGALVMTMTRSLVRMAASRNISPRSTLIKANRIIAKDIRRGMFVTAIYGILDLKERALTLCSAGHNPAVVCRADGTVEKINPKGMAIGFDKGPLFDKTLQEQVIPLNPGDRVVLYTDGVVEAMNDNREEYTEEALLDYCQRNFEQESIDFVKGLFDELEAHRGRAPQHDDITIVTFRAL